MRNSIYSFLFYLMTSNAAISQELSLNGLWNFKASNTISEEEVLSEDYTKWDTLQVPGNWDTHDRYSTYTGKGYYQKNISVPKSWKGKQIRITFEAVYETSKVWVNGKLMGTHIGGYLPFEYNITEYLNLAGENSVVVMADNTYKRGAWWAWGGISRSVSIQANEDL